MSGAPRDATDDPRDITAMLAAFAAGDAAAREELILAVYQRLKDLARRQLRNGDRALAQPTALVHETYMRILAPQGAPRFENRDHFYATAARCMRRIVVDWARARDRQKRGGGRDVRLADADEAGVILENHEVLRLDEAISELAKDHPRAADGVVLRFFGGLNHAEIGASLGISEITAQRDWRFARAWLRRHLEKEEIDPQNS